MTSEAEPQSVQDLIDRVAEAQKTMPAPDGSHPGTSHPEVFHRRHVDGSTVIDFWAPTENYAQVLVRNTESGVGNTVVLVANRNGRGESVRGSRNTHGSRVRSIGFSEALDVAASAISRLPRTRKAPISG